MVGVLSHGCFLWVHTNAPAVLRPYKHEPIDMCCIFLVPPLGDLLVTS